MLAAAKKIGHSSEIMSVFESCQSTDLNKLIYMSDLVIAVFRRAVVAQGYLKGVPILERQNPDVQLGLSRQKFVQVTSEGTAQSLGLREEGIGFGYIPEHVYEDGEAYLQGNERACFTVHCSTEDGQPVDDIIMLQRELESGRVTVGRFLDFDPHVSFAGGGKRVERGQTLELEEANLLLTSMAKMLEWSE